MFFCGGKVIKTTLISIPNGKIFSLIAHARNMNIAGALSHVWTPFRQSAIVSV